MTGKQTWQTIPEMVLSAADRFGDAEAVVDGPLRLTFTQLVDRIRCAAGVFAEAGIGKGDRVAIWAPNSAEWVIAAFGLLTAGGVLVPVNTRFKTMEAYPAEIEGFLLEHPAVTQAAVVGVPDERLGQLGKAFVVVKTPVSEYDLITWCRQRMAGFKAPQYVEFVDELPLNATGKVMKEQLR